MTRANSTATTRIHQTRTVPMELRFARRTKGVLTELCFALVMVGYLRDGVFFL